VNVLVTSSRLPVALDVIRKLGRAGHRVFAADTFRSAPGSYSRWVEARAWVAPPAFEPERFIADIKQLVLLRRIELIVPCFEEVFFLARHLDELSEIAPVFTSSFDILSQLHDKARFVALARRLGLRAPESTVVRSPRELTAATKIHRRYFAKPVFSRGGVELLTNVGPLAALTDCASIAPSPLRPWIVQEYVDGIDRCTFGIAQHGRLVAHCTYLHPSQIEHAGGIVFESIDDPGALAYTERIVAAVGYHGQIGLDLRRDGDELVVLECNARPTAGVHLMSDEMFVDAMMSARRRDRVRVVPAGARRLYASALVRDLLLHPANLFRDLSYLRSTRDVYAEQGDRWPALLQFLSYSRVVAYLRRHGHPPRRGTALIAAYFDGIDWDGQPIP
jgi:predicted ATP-grasp superfamily ATP-dependent carboligase